MKKAIYWVVMLLVSMIGMGVTASVHASSSPRDMFVETVSPLKYEATVEALKAEMAADGWSVLAAHNLAAKLAEKGHSVLPVTIIEGCSGKFSLTLLKNDATRYVATMLPCRVAVYETSDGKVIISRMNTHVMGAQMEPAVAEVMNKAGASIEAVIARLNSKK